MGYLLWKRQDDLAGSDYSTNDGSNSDDNSDGWSGYDPTADAIKWIVVGAVLLLLLLWLIGGHYHAQRRIRMGQAPLAYHRFLVRRQQRAHSAPRSLFFQHQQPVYGQEYPMQPYPHSCPPPAYNAAHSAPPAYVPPAGLSKIDPDQEYGTLPAGPPPPRAVDAGESSSAAMQNVSSNQTPDKTDTQVSGKGTEDKRASFAARLNPLNRGSSSQ